ncbi:MAG: hypothetical protein V4510_00485 [bacterium]
MHPRPSRSQHNAWLLAAAAIVLLVTPGCVTNCQKGPLLGQWYDDGTYSEARVKFQGAIPTGSPVTWWSGWRDIPEGLPFVDETADAAFHGDYRLMTMGHQVGTSAVGIGFGCGSNCLNYTASLAGKYTLAGYFEANVSRLAIAEDFLAEITTLSPTERRALAEAWVAGPGIYGHHEWYGDVPLRLEPLFVSLHPSFAPHSWKAHVDEGWSFSFTWGTAQATLPWGEAEADVAIDALDRVSVGFQHGGPETEADYEAASRAILRTLGLPPPSFNGLHTERPCTV